MKQSHEQAHTQRFFATTLLVGILTILSVAGLIATAFAYTLLGDREIRMGSSQPGDVNDYTVEFDVSTSGDLGGIVVTFCANTPTIGDPECEIPNNFRIGNSLDNLSAGDINLSGYYATPSQHASSGTGGNNTIAITPKNVPNTADWNEVESVTTGDIVWTDHLLETSSGNLLWSLGSADNTAYLYYSSDGGISWSEVESIDSGGSVLTNHLLEASHNDFYWSFSQNNTAYLYRSTNGGTSWSEVESVTTGGNVWTDHLLETSSGSILWSFSSWDTTAYLYRSTDGGTSWSEVESVNIGLNARTNHLFETSSGNLLWSFGDGLPNFTAYLYRSTNGGTSWSEVESITTSNQITTDHLLETSSGDLFWSFGSYDNTAYLYRSTNGGTSWSEVESVTTSNNIQTDHLLETSSGDLFWSFGSWDNTAYLYVADSSQGSPISVAADEKAIFDFVNVTNQDVQGTFFARIYTYDDPGHALGYTLEDPWAGGDVIDAGGVALSTADTIDITFMVQERITFCVFTNELSAPGDYQTCSGTSVGPVIMGDDNGFLSVNEPSISKDTKYNIATNASAGATIRVRGNTLASGSAMIDSIGSTPTSSVTGTEQFGLCTYLHPNSLSGGLAPSSPYNHADCVNTVAGQGSGNDAGAQFAFDDTGISSVYGQAIATKTAGDWSTGKLVLLANVSNVTQPGIYTTEFYIVATGRY